MFTISMVCLPFYPCFHLFTVNALLNLSVSINTCLGRLLISQLSLSRVLSLPLPLPPSHPSNPPSSPLTIQQKKQPKSDDDDEVAAAPKLNRMPTAAAAAKRSKKRRASSSSSSREVEDPDVIPFLASTRFKRGSALTSSGAGGVLGTLAKRAGKALVASSVFRFVAEEKIFETVVGMLAYRVAFQWSKDTTATKKARLLFTVYICLYLGALLYSRQQAIVLQDTRTVKVAAMPAMLSSLFDVAKKLKKGEGLGSLGGGGGMGGLMGGLQGVVSPQEKEMKFKEYDLSQVKSALDRFSMFLVGMTFLHFKMKNTYMIMYWG